MATYADAVAGVHTAIAAYAQAVDDGRSEDIVATFCEDGVIYLPGVGLIAGREALAGLALQGVSRHVVTSTLVTGWSDNHAEAISDLVVISQAGESEWVIRLVGRYWDTLHNYDGAWRFHSRAMRFVD